MKLEYKYGLSIGVGVSCWVMAEFFLGFHTTRLSIGEYSGYIAILIPIIVLWRALSEKRQASGSLSYGAAFKSGLIISFIAALFISVFFALYIFAINPRWLDLGLAYERSKLLGLGITEEEIILQTDAMAALYTPQIQIASAFFGTLIQGIGLSITLAFFIRRRTRVS